MYITLKRSPSALLVLMCIIVAAAWLLGGCSGGQGTVPQATGQVQVAVGWPETSGGQVDSQLIPARSHSVHVELFHGDTVVAEELLVRPDEPPWGTEAVFDPVPADTLILRAAAYPDAEGGGVAQAAAQMQVEVPPGGMGYPADGDPGDPVNLVLESTITQVVVSPAEAQVEADSQLQMTATARDEQGRTVLVPTAGAFEWSVTPDSMQVGTAAAVMTASETMLNPGAASITEQGLLTGRSIGGVSVTALEKESQVAGTEVVTVREQLYEMAWRVATNSPYAATSGRLAADDEGMVYVPDRLRGLVLRFSAGGEQQTSLGSGEDYHLLEGVTLSHADNMAGAVWIHLSSLEAPMIRRLDPMTGYEGPTWGVHGDQDGQIGFPAGMAFGPEANSVAYIADPANQRVQQFDTSGDFLGAIDGSAVSALANWHPLDVDVDGQGNVYLLAAITDADYAVAVEKFDSNGAAVGWWGKNTEGNVGWHPAGSDAQPASGDEPGAFGEASGLAVNVDGELYVVDAILNRVTKLRLGSGGGVLAMFTGQVSEEEFFSPVSIAANANGEVYVVGSTDGLLYKFRRAGERVADRSGAEP